MNIYGYKLSKAQEEAAEAVFSVSPFTEEDVIAAMVRTGVPADGGFARRAAREAIATARTAGLIAFDGEMWCPR